MVSASGARPQRRVAPPGPAEDPWGPYIREASARFDIPDPWIRSLMRVESGGKEYLNGGLITSGAGAMGLMQVMPQTYATLRARLGLGANAYDPQIAQALQFSSDERCLGFIYVGSSDEPSGATARQIERGGAVRDWSG